MVESIYTNQCVPLDANDEEARRERTMLQRQYYQFLAVILTNNLTEVLLAQNSGLVTRVMLTVVHGSVETPDPVVNY